ncbi:MAG TPA: hypothetical protein VGW10_11220 [Solirubrobacteraceae bacterium]|nr:hypothetical protein [Solirubrobacteraceae bacterium]
MTDLVAPRFPDVPRDAGLYESYFLKAHHPEKPQAFWMRHTIHKRPGYDPIGSVWLTLFNADAKEPVKATKENFPAGELATDGLVRIGGSSFEHGAARGGVPGTRWDFTFATHEPEQRHMPNEWMYTAAVPRTKSLTPWPAARFTGKLGRYDLDGWTGVVSHNWGTEHAERWIYLHCCHFAGHDEHTWLELVTGRIKLGPVTTPWIANGALQLDGVRHRLGGPQRARSTKVEEHATAARFVLTGDDVRVEGELAAPRERFVAWRYASPDMDERHSVHCSITDLRLHVRRAGRDDVELISPAGATYELGMRPNDEHGIPLQPYEDGRL